MSSYCYKGSAQSRKLLGTESVKVSIDNITKTLGGSCRCGLQDDD